MSAPSSARVARTARANLQRGKRRGMVRFVLDGAIMVDAACADLSGPQQIGGLELAAQVAKETGRPDQGERSSHQLRRREELCPTGDRRICMQAAVAA